MDGSQIEKTVATAAAARSEAAQSAPAAKVTPGPGFVSLDTHVDPLALVGGLIERYGDVIGYQTRFGPCFIFIRPQHVQEILHSEDFRRASLVKMMLGNGLLATDGPQWRSQRRLMQRDFQPAALRPFHALIVRQTSQMAAEWTEAAQRGETINVSTAMIRLTLRIIIEALFSEELSPQRTRELCDAITLAVTELGRISWTIFGIPTTVSRQSDARLTAGKKIIDDTCAEMIARRRARRREDRPRDLLTLLIESQNDGVAMDDRLLRDEIVTMLVGGHETTALAMAWTWKLLAEHPNIETALHQELDEHMSLGQDVPVDLSRFTWTRGIVQETMRLYPPVWSIARVAQRDDMIDGHAIPRGACVLVSPWFTHRHKDYWQDPERFDPTRFIAPNQPAHRYAWFPFGGGRHQCIGMHLAMMEGTILLAQLARQFRVRPVNGAQIKPVPGISLRQSPEMLATIELRAANCEREVLTAGGAKVR